jgi:hypothetical protein
MGRQPYRPAFFTYTILNLFRRRSLMAENRQYGMGGFPGMMGGSQMGYPMMGGSQMGYPGMGGSQMGSGQYYPATPKPKSGS